MDGIVLEGRGNGAAVHERALDDALTEWGLAVDEDVRTLLAGHAYDTDFVRGCEHLGVHPVSFYRTRESHSVRRALDRIDGGDRGLYPDADVITSLANRCELALVSNNYDDVVRFVVDRFEFDAFSFARGRDAGVRGFYRRKPDPYYVLECLDAFAASDGLYVGDRETDVLAATRAGLESVFLRRDHNSGVSLSVEPTHEIGSLGELPDLIE